MTTYSVHVGRSWFPATVIEDACPCGKAPCGLVDSERIHPDCLDHRESVAKTMRQIHKAENCVPEGAVSL